VPQWYMPRRVLANERTTVYVMQSGTIRGWGAHKRRVPQWYTHYLHNIVTCLSGSGSGLILGLRYIQL
jgi:hypothetical protein